MDQWIDRSIDGWMDGWRSTNHWNDGWMVRRGPKRLGFRCGDLVSGSYFFLLFSEGFFLIFFDVGSIFGGFGKPKRKPKSIFGTFFFDAFFECILASILGCCLEARNLKNTNFSEEKITIFTKSTFSKKVRKNVDFGIVLGGQNDEKSRKKSSWKPCVSLTLICYRLFADFCDFGSILGGPGPSKNR